MSHCIACLTLLVTVALPFSLAAQNTAVVAEHLYTMDAGPQGGPGMVLIRDGKIDDIRQGANLQPPAGFQVIHGAYVTPGLVDADTTAGTEKPAVAASVRDAPPPAPTPAAASDRTSRGPQRRSETRSPTASP